MIKRIKGAFIVFLLFSATAAARDNRGSSAGATAKGQTGRAPGNAEDGDNPSDGLAKAAAEYKSALTDLASLYDADLKKKADHNAKMKELFDMGIVARVELEKSEADVADAQAKLDAVRMRISSAEAAEKARVDGWSQSTELAVQWTTGDVKLDGLIRHYGGMYGVDPFLVYCVARQESGFTASAISSKGARGIMQLMPDTAVRYGATDPFNPEQNIRAGVHYLKDLLQRFNGNIDLALAGYNAGEGAVIRNGNMVPAIPETQYYVRAIGKRYGSRPNTEKTATKKKKADRSTQASSDHK